MKSRSFENNASHSLCLCAWTIGFSTLGLQILVIREILAASHGNELNLGILLTCWLFWSGLGSIVGRSIWSNLTQCHMLWLLMALALLITPTVLTMKATRILIGLTPGELPSNNSIFLSSIMILSGFCFMGGMAFALGSRLSLQGGWKRNGPSRFYAWEASGALCAAILLRVMATRHLDLSIYLGIITLPLLITIRDFTPSVSRIRIIIISILLLLPIYKSMEWNQRIETASWPGYTLIDSQDTPHGRVQLLEKDQEISLFVNHALVGTSTITSNAEEAVHIPMAIHPDPHHILVLEGGYSGILAELQKYPEINITAALLNEWPLKILSRYPESNITAGFFSPAIHLIWMDARKFVEMSHLRSYDVVISCAPEPASIGASRFYTLEFFQDVQRILTEDGIFSMRLQSSDNFLSPCQQQYLKIALTTLRRAFGPDGVRILPGDTADIIASPNTDLLKTISADLILERLSERNIQSSYVSAAYLPYRLIPSKMKTIEEQFDSEPSVVTTDQYPHIFPAFLRLWESQFDRSFSWLPELPRIRIFQLTTTLLLLWNILLFIVRRNDLLPIQGCVTAVGCTQLIIEIILIFLLQVTSGAAFLKSGVLIGLFSSGLAAGSIIGNRAWNNQSLTRNTILFNQLTIAALVSLIGLPQMTSWDGHELLWDMLSFVIAFFGGTHFVLCSQLYPEKTAALYGLDLVGSAMGAFFISTVLLPNLSIPDILILLFMVLVGTAIPLRFSGASRSG